MIDVHCHILPGIDDGASDYSVSLSMAQAFAAQGVSVVACTPHILPGLYHNTGPDIRVRVEKLQRVLDEYGVALQLVTGADAHITPDFVARLRSGRILSIANSRYVLVEPPHHTAPPQLEEFFFNILIAGYVPVLTHPERLSWVPSRYEVIKRLAGQGVWMQITAGSLAGAFGRSALYWAERMLGEGLVHVLATDAHDAEYRPPDLDRGRELAEKRVGVDEAENLVVTRPIGIVKDLQPSDLPMPGGVANGDVGDRVNPDREGRPHGSSGRHLRGLSGRLRQFFGRKRELHSGREFDGRSGGIRPNSSGRYG